MSAHNVAAQEKHAHYPVNWKRGLVPGYGYFDLGGRSLPAARDTPAKGAIFTNVDTGNRYRNVGTKAAPSWEEVGGESDLPDPIVVNTINERTANAGVSVGSLFKTKTAQVIDMNDAAVTLTRVAGAPTGTMLASNVLRVDPNSGQASENLLLPPEADCAGLFLMIVNTGGEAIALQNDAGGALLTIPTACSVLVFCDGTAWSHVNTANSLKTNTVDEATANAGVTVDEVLCKNGRVLAKVETKNATAGVLGLLAADTGSWSTLASADVVNLPAAVVGMIFPFSIASAGTPPQINPNGTDTITLNGTEQAAGAYIVPSAAGDWAILVCFANNKWVAMTSGTWSYEGA
jgi:hypothetical protein